MCIKLYWFIIVQLVLTTLWQKPMCKCLVFMLTDKIWRLSDIVYTKVCLIFSLCNRLRNLKKIQWVNWLRTNIYRNIYSRLTYFVWYCCTFRPNLKYYNFQRISKLISYLCLPIETHSTLLTLIAFPDSWTMASKMSPTIKHKM